MAEASRESEIGLALSDDTPNQEEGATGGGPEGTPGTGVEGRGTGPASTAAATGTTTTTTAAPTLSLSPFLSSSRGAGGGGGLDRDSLGGRRSPESYQRELEQAYRRIAQQDAMLDELQRLRELERERSREVREGLDEERQWGHRESTRMRAADRTEVSGRFIHPGPGEPVTSTPLRLVGFDLEEGHSRADLSAQRATSTSVGYPGRIGPVEGHSLGDLTPGRATS
jgi:hypothetical protein